MSEEQNKLDVFELFQQSQLTLEEAEEKAKQEAGRPKVERFRIGEDGEYSIRILPLAPQLDESGTAKEMDRKGWEYALHQLFLKINLPANKGKKSKSINIPVIKTTDKGVGMSVDLIDTYVNIAKELYSDDKDLIDAITGNSFSGGLRWSYQHAIYVLNVDSDKERAKGPQLWQCSHSQYSTIRDAEIRLWKEIQEDGEKQPYSPIAGLLNAYPVKVIRKTDKKTEYTFEIGRKIVNVTKDEIQKLLDMPRISELIYNFTRYQLEAEIVFLQQYDEIHQMKVCDEPDFKEAVEKLKGELSPDDTSHFDLASAGSGKGGDTTDVTIDSLWSEYDKISDAGLSERSDEYQELREKIRQFAEDNNLDVRLSRSKNNQQLLEEVEQAYDELKKQPSKTVSEQDYVEEAPSTRKSHTTDQKEVADDTEGVEEEQPVRRRRPRPTAGEEEPAEENQLVEEAEEVKEVEDDEPIESEHMLHRRRRR